MTSLPNNDSQEDTMQDKPAMKSMEEPPEEAISGSNEVEN